jgi:hypothetical protein
MFSPFYTMGSNNPQKPQSNIAEETKSSEVSTTPEIRNKIEQEIQDEFVRLIACYNSGISEYKAVPFKTPPYGVENRNILWEKGYEYAEKENQLTNVKDVVEDIIKYSDKIYGGVLLRHEDIAKLREMLNIGD